LFQSRRLVHDWDFLITVAGVAVGLQTLFPQVNNKTFRKLYSAVVNQLVEWNPYANASLNNLQRFYNKNRELGFDFVSASGIWVVWNILKRPPSSEDEISMALSVAEIIRRDVRRWWYA